MESTKTVWTFDPDHCNIRFVAKHLLLSEVEGAFLLFRGSTITDDGDFKNPQITFEIDAASIKTSSEIRDRNLRSTNFFDVEAYPKIHFTSAKFRRVLGSQFIMVGDLTIKNVTKPIELNVQFNGIGEDFSGRTKAGFKVTGLLNRFDYNIAFHHVLEELIDVGAEIIFTCNIELFKAEEASLSPTA